MIENPTAESQAARLPLQQMARRAESSNEYFYNVTATTEIFGSKNDMARTRGSTVSGCS